MQVHDKFHLVKKLSDSKPMFIRCWPLKLKSLILPFNFPQAIIEPAKDIEPIIKPRSMISNSPIGKIEGVPC